MAKLTFTPQRLIIWAIFWPVMAIYRLLGWRFINEVDAHIVPKAVIVAAPHTSNFDALLLLPLATFYARMPATMVKEDWTKGIWALPARIFNVIPINRSAAHDIVFQMRETFASRERLVVAITPEGTRSYTEYWKSGFYNIALGADVPIILLVMDFKAKAAGMKLMFQPSGDIEADMDKLRAGLEGVQGRHPEKMGPIRVRVRDAARLRSQTASVTSDAATPQRKANRE
jgi:1-acyl-sn-glycerol-3-phosphate acyltransferase